MARIAYKLKKAPKKPVIHVVNRDMKTFKARMIELKLFFEKYKQIAFFELFSEHCKRIEIVLTFMAVLKMASDGMIELLQTKPFADVIIRRKESGWAKLK
jgi:chromatin segregation and condensation protein Rec8/ScpA/Scc1 (kleisin family)